MNKKFGLSIVAATLATPMTLFGQTVSTRADFLGSGSESRRAAKETAIAFLTKPVEEVDWDEKPFEEVIDWLRDEGNDRVNILPRWNALSAESVDQDAFVSLKLRNTTVGEVLAETLDYLSDNGELAYRASGNKLKISTKTDFNRKLELRVYDITDIVFRVPDMGQGAPRIDLQQQQSSGGGGGAQSVFGGGGGGGGGQEQGGRQAEQEAEERVTELVTKITQTIAPGTWRTGGAAANPAATGSIVAHNRSLIVLHTIEVHEQLAGAFVRGNN